MWRLSPQELRQLFGLIGSAYPTSEELKTLVELGGRNLEVITPLSALLPSMILAVVLKAQTDGWLSELVEAVKRDKPRASRHSGVQP